MSDEVRHTIAELWREALNVTEVTDTDNFFDLGGHSLIALNVMADIEERYGIELDGMRDIWENPTLEQFASLVAARAEAKPAPSPGMT